MNKCPREGISVACVGVFGTVGVGLNLCGPDGVSVTGRNGVGDPMGVGTTVVPPTEMGATVGRGVGAAVGAGIGTLVGARIGALVGICVGIFV